jgi:phosphatidylinositol alpha-1,6-mannosyltransferase
MSRPKGEQAMTGWQRVRARTARRVRRRFRALPRRLRRLAREVITGAETALAVRRDGRMRHEDALRLLADAARRNPADLRVTRLRAQVLARTGRLTEALAAATALVVAQDRVARGRAPGPEGQAAASNRRLQRTLQGRVAETDAGWRPRVPGGPPSFEPAPGRVLYLAKESFPHRNNGYCTRTHETLLAVRAAGRDARAVTLPGFPEAGAEKVGRTSVVDGVEYRHVLPGAAGTLGELSWEEYLQLTVTAFAREVARVRPEVLHTGSGRRGYDLALVGQALAGWAGLPWIYEVRSFFETTWTPDERYAEHAEYYRRRFASETRAMTAADAVVTLTGAMREEIVTAPGFDPG